MNVEFTLMHVSRGAVLEHELAVAIGTFDPALSAHVQKYSRMPQGVTASRTIAGSAAGATVATHLSFLHFNGFWCPSGRIHSIF